MSFRPTLVALSVVCLIGVLPADDAFAQKKRPPVEFDSNETPLQKAVKEAYKKNVNDKNEKKGPRPKKDQCAEAIASGNPSRMAAQCDDLDIGNVTLEKLGEQDLKHPGNKAAGKRVVTRTVMRYTNPKTKGRSDDAGLEKWPATKLKALKKTKDHFPGPSTTNAAGGRGHSFGSAFLPSPSDNDDKDCFDMLTGEHFGGLGIADGDAQSCFDAEAKLVGTLTETSETTCVHRNGSAYFGDKTDGIEDDCFGTNDLIKTTLVELVDEDDLEEVDNDGDGATNEDIPDGINNDNDCLTIDGQRLLCADALPGQQVTPYIDEDGEDIVDNDGDGDFGEDPPAAHTQTDCVRFYAKFGLTPTAAETAGGDCDMSRALVKFVNAQSMKEENGGKKFYKADENGVFDEEVEGGIEPGTEGRKVVLTESFGVKCKSGTTFMEGVCVPDDEILAAGGSAAVMRVLGTMTNSHDDAEPDVSRIAMMGFTFAPPVIEWGYRIDESVCIDLLFDEVCFEVFYARIGYEFDVALGLRLPVEIEVLDAPESILAGTSETIDTALEPLDFTTSQYEQFCLENGLDQDWFIGGGGGLSPCRRFGFTNFLDEMVPVIPDNKKDGDEFVARYSIFAGIVVRVLMIPVINWAIDSSLDLPAACTMMRILEILKNPGDIPAGDIADFIQAMMGFGGGLEEGATDLIAFIKDKAGACGTFETPFGRDDDGAIRGFPFSGEYSIRADCAEALARGEVITIKGQPRPICTNMILGVSGASLGVGLGLEARAGSDLIESDFSTSEDARLSGEVRWRKASNEDSPEVGITINADNYDSTPHKDNARIKLDDFIYYLNLIEIALKANLQFGGILSPIPDIGSFPIYRLQISLDDFGLPIPQHPGTDGVALSIPVENYGLSVDVKPVSDDAEVRIDNETLLIKPGEFGDYVVKVHNHGSRPGTFDEFQVKLSNVANQTPPYRFGINPNTDLDCVDAAGACTAAWPRFYGTECYSAEGSLLAGRTACTDEDSPSDVEGLSAAQRDDDGDGTPDEDPPDVWRTTPDAPAFNDLLISGIQPYTTSTTESLIIAVSPFRHPLTKTGVYPIEITADSQDARTRGMASPDPSGITRRNAVDTALLLVQSFFEPQVVVLPNFDGGKPGETRTYIVEGTNGGNSDDSMTVVNAFLDYNTAGCTLTTLGGDGCAYRAVPTLISTDWTTVGSLPATLPPSGQLTPLSSARASFDITPPRDWAGMTDTTYEFRLTTTSTEEPGTSRSFVAKHTVTATQESMTRYIGLEIAELTQTLLDAEAAGQKLGGTKPIVMKPITQTHERALQAVVAGDLAGASSQHRKNINLMEAFVKALDGGGKSLPAELFADLHARAAAILADLAAAEASTVTSAP